jgi:hypothetical protein
MNINYNNIFILLKKNFFFNKNFFIFHTEKNLNYNVYFLKLFCKIILCLKQITCNSNLCESCNLFYKGIHPDIFLFNDLNVNSFQKIKKLFFSNNKISNYKIIIIMHISNFSLFKNLLYVSTINSRIIIFLFTNLFILNIKNYLSFNCVLFKFSSFMDSFKLIRLIYKFLLKKISYNKFIIDVFDFNKFLILDKLSLFLVEIVKNKYTRYKSIYKISKSINHRNINNIFYINNQIYKLKLLLNENNYLNIKYLLKELLKELSNIIIIKY